MQTIRTLNHMPHKIILSIIFFLSVPIPAHAQLQQTQTYARAHIENIEEINAEDGTHTQNITINIRSGEEKGKSITIGHAIDQNLQTSLRFKKDQTILITHYLETTDSNGNTLPEQYFIVEPYRIPALAYSALIFIVLVIWFGRKQGLASIIGLMITIAVLVKLVVPAMLAGMHPLQAMLIGAAIIILASLYVAHGFNTRTTIALISITITFSISVLLAWLAVWATGLLGFGSETAFFLQQDLPIGFDFRGLLLGGMLLGALGVLDDITTGQSAAVEEIHKANTSLDAKELYKRGLSVGREHIASLVNTLVLAYAGASFPVLLYLSIYTQPLWVTLNNELFAEEIIRTLAGSTALVLAVPITTAIAAWYFGTHTKKCGQKETIHIS